MTNQSVYAVMLINHVHQHYIGNLDLESKRHTADNIHLAVKSLLGEHINLVKGVVTDNPSAMKKFRNQLCEEFPKIQNMICVLHSLNLVCRDVVKSCLISADAKNVSTLVLFFHHSEHWKGILLKWGKANKITRFINKHVETRWYSYVKMCLSAATWELGFKHCVNLASTEKELHPAINKEIIEIVKSDIFQKLQFQNQVLQPIADAIACLERKDANLSDVWVCLWKLYRYYRAVNENTLTKRQLDLSKFVLQRLSLRASESFSSDLYIIAFYLTPQYRYICT